MWASAPTNIHEKSTNFEGGQGRPPLQRSMKNHAGQAKNRRVFRFTPGGPMWASAPTNIREKSTDFEGGQSRPPLQIAVDNFDSLSSAPTNGRKNRILHRSPLQTALALPKQTVRSTEHRSGRFFIAALQGCAGSGEASAQNRSLPDAPLWTGPSRPCARAAPGGPHNSRSGRTGCTAHSGARAHTWT